MNSNLRGFQDRIVDFKFDSQSLLTPLDQFPSFPNSSVDGFRLSDRTSISSSNQYPELENTFKLSEPSPDLHFVRNPLLPYEPDPSSFSPPASEMPEGESFPATAGLNVNGGTFPVSLGLSPGGDSSSDESDFKETVLQYISQMLMEENMEDQPCMFFDPLGLEDTEKSFYDALGKNYPPTPNRPPLDSVDPEAVARGNDSDSTSNDAILGTGNSTDLPWVLDPEEHKHSILPRPFSGNMFQSNLQLSSSGDISNLANSNELVTELLARNIFSDSGSIMQYKKGLEEASKFLPQGNQLNIDLGSGILTRETSKVTNVTEKGRKNHEREDVVVLDLKEGRRNKHAANYVEDIELSDMFDKVLLYDGGNEALKNGVCEKLQVNEQLQASVGEKAREKRLPDKGENSVDLRSLLMLCAQAVSIDDRRTAQELLKQIRLHSTPFGDGSQRMAHYFANAIEARMAGTGTGTKIYFNALAHSKISAADMLKAYQAHLISCPFKKLSIFFLIKMILKVCDKAKSLHIVDFGICYGFWWPMLIQFLSHLPDGPPKLRITGIEYPQPGFRPMQKIDETGRRLAKYCERFGVPFQYQAIASQNWETIRIEDLQLDSNDVLAVSNLFRFKNLLDETIEENNPRDVVLHLIRKMNPNIFINSIDNGSYNAPFFITRFREALFHFSSVYDVLDNTAPRESPERMMLEREFLGRQVMNVVACEGAQRVERPETYKQWQVRSLRAGFKPLPLDQEIMEKFRVKLATCYHKDFVLDQDGNWMLQGWKGRIIYASSCWIPA